MHCFESALAANHGAYERKEFLGRMLHEADFEVLDFGNRKSVFRDNYPDFIAPTAHAVASGNVQRGVAICGIGVGAHLCSLRGLDHRQEMKS